MRFLLFSIFFRIPTFLYGWLYICLYINSNGSSLDDCFSIFNFHLASRMQHQSSITITCCRHIILNNQFVCLIKAERATMFITILPNAFSKKGILIFRQIRLQKFSLSLFSPKESSHHLTLFLILSPNGIMIT